MITLVSNADLLSLLNTLTFPPPPTASITLWASLWLLACRLLACVSQHACVLSKDCWLFFLKIFFYFRFHHPSPGFLYLITSHLLPVCVISHTLALGFLLGH